jgi:hypothetical protein
MDARSRSLVARRRLAANSVKSASSSRLGRSEGITLCVPPLLTNDVRSSLRAHLSVEHLFDLLQSKPLRQVL